MLCTIKNIYAFFYFFFFYLYKIIFCLCNVLFLKILKAVLINLNQEKFFWNNTVGFCIFKHQSAFASFGLVLYLNFLSRISFLCTKSCCKFHLIFMKFLRVVSLDTDSILSYFVQLECYNLKNKCREKKLGKE